MGKFKPAPKQAPPAYMVSFCDMMTLILTFFILLVSMSKEQQAGLLAEGVGSFIVAVKSHGLNGILSGVEKQEVFDHTRRKFNLPPEEDPKRRAEDHTEASTLELIKAKQLNSLAPHDELTYPQVASFATDSSELSLAGKSYLERLAPSLLPKHNQLLVIEGHANDAGPNHNGNNHALSIARANSVRGFLLERFGFSENRVHARAWFLELEGKPNANRFVDIRLVTPASKK